MKPHPVTAYICFTCAARAKQVRPALGRRAPMLLAKRSAISVRASRAPAYRPCSGPFAEPDS